MKIIRDLPETNSSSSHSVVLGTSERFDRDNSLSLNADGNIVIENSDYRFDEQTEKFNDATMKLLYAYGLTFSLLSDESISMFRQLKEIEDVVLGFTGAKKLIIPWFDEYFKDRRKNRNNDYEICFSDYTPSVDHQSLHEMTVQIFESPETLKDFIFNKNSVLYIKGDGYEPSIEYLGLGDEGILGYVTLHFTNKDVDVEIYEYPIDLNDHCSFGSDMTTKIISGIRTDRIGNICNDGECFISKFDMVNKTATLENKKDENVVEIRFDIETKEFGKE